MTDKPIGIVTLSGDMNYGNRLQNYALQQAIKSLGYPNVESLDGFPRHESKPLKVRRILATAYGRRQEIVSRTLRRAAAHRAADIYECPLLRRKAIQTFSDRYITPAPRRYPGSDSGHAFIDRYHRFVVGSDQVWNPAFTKANPEWFLAFARPEQRVAYAASIGIPRIPGYLHSRYRKGLRRIEKISVREYQAAATVREFTGRTPPVVLDPTMLLSRDQWDEVAVQPSQLQTDSYIATFMLSEGDSTSLDKPDLGAVRRHAQNHNLEIVDLHSPKDPAMIALGPGEFIGAIRGATLMVTDSFHASVFATLFHVPFLLVPRGAMNSRFETLLTHTGLGNRMLSQVPDIAAALDIEWSDADSRLEGARKYSLEFLAKALS